MPALEKLPMGPMYEETRYTDGVHVNVTIRKPVDNKGNPDSSRPILYIGHTAVNFGGMPPIPITFLIEGANSVESALQLYESNLHKAAQAALIQMGEEARRQKQQIVTATQVPPIPGMMTSAIAPKTQRGEKR